MIDKIKQKIKQGWEKVCEAGRWVKNKGKQVLIGLGIIGIALAVTTLNGEIPSVIAEGEIIEFAYTDENVGEDIIIRTDQQVYNPLWAWNGFDVYVMVKNESGKTQHVSVSPFFSKDFTIESIAILDSSATTIIKEPIYEEVCEGNVASTTCRNEKIGEKDKEVMGRWNNVLSPTFFSEEDYQQFISDNNIQVKDKGNRKAKQKFGALFVKNQTVYFKVRLKANEPFSIEEFDLEIIGDKSAYGILDPTIFADDFNSYNNGDLSTQGDWSGDTGFDVVAGDATNPEGASVGKQINFVNPGSTLVITKTGTARNEGKLTIYLKSTSLTENAWIRIREGATIRLMVGLVGSIGSGIIALRDGAWQTIGSFTASTWVKIEFEWQDTGGTNPQQRASVNGGAWTGWYEAYSDWTVGLDVVELIVGSGTYTASFDYIAQELFPSAVRRIMDIE